ncbi:MAG: TonB-dependent receptor plug domain-containing protein, partial [Gemmatimonadetes bacterium]|nr:TonB-dependent receptor plug domain-containing protein [Gemmatimonadota bacterium]
MAETAVALDEIVVTGTPGAVEARTVGNALTRTAVAAVLQATPVVNVQEVLATRVPGVMIMSTQGVVGTGSVARIRGVSSLFLPNDPLLYVDGVRVDNNTRAGPYIRGGSQVSRLSDLSPEEIESVEVIKGPAAGTLYGTEASRGVIQILTRRGVQGPPRFGITVRHGANWFRNPEGRLNWAFTRNAAGQLDSVNLYQREADAGQPIFRTGRPQAYNINLSGGTPVVRYYASAGFDRDEGVVSYDWRNRLSTRANLTVLPSDQLDIETSLGFVRNRARLGQMTSVGAEIGWDMMTQLNWGGFRYLNSPNRGFFRATPENSATIESRTANDRVLGSAQLRHRPWRWFSQRLTLGMDAGDETSSVLFPSDPALPFGPELSEGDKTVDRRRVTVASLDYAASVSSSLGQMTSTTSLGAQLYSKRIEAVQA